MNWSSWTWRGLIVFALGVAVAAFVVARVGVNPVDTVENAGESAAKALSIISGVCPDGWKDASERDEHGRVSACFQGDPNKPKAGEWLVIFDRDGNFEHALQIDTPGAEIVTDKSKVPGWPR